MGNCNCDEGKNMGNASQAHDCAYVAARNRLIPHAEEVAKQAVAAEVTRINRASARIPLESPDSAAMRSLWSREFVAAMDALAVETGLVGRKGTA